MCGIAGLVSPNGDAVSIRDAITRMTDAIRHRGPDDSGLFVERGMGLGMRRLSIIDVEGGHQPVANEDETVLAVLNGEIYNYRELQGELRRSGHHLRTESDTEVIVHLYEEHGERFVEKLRGMFALAVWDRPRRKLILAVDRLGIKPLYHASFLEGLTFASELKALWPLDRRRDLDPLGMSQYFSLGYIPAPRTCFKDVFKLAPGTMLVLGPQAEPQLRQYWTVPDRPREPIEQTAVLAQVKKLLQDAVRSHLVSDVPVGAFLSGGLDSSAVVALMARASSAPIRTFCVGFADATADERPFARTVARHLGTDHHELVVEPAEPGLLAGILGQFDEPFADSSAVPTYFVSQMARAHVKVALSGDGGDELFLGYPIFHGLDVARRMEMVPGPFRRSTSALLESFPMGHGGFGETLAPWRKRLVDSLMPMREAYRSKVAIGGVPGVWSYLTRDFVDSLDVGASFDPLLKPIDMAERRGGHRLEPYVSSMLSVSLPGDMLTKVDRMSMANSLEVRVPLLDHPLVEFVAGLGIEQRLRGGQLKALLKEAVADLLPASIIHRKKHGFNIPMSAWFRGGVGSFARDVLLSRSVRERGLIDVTEVERLFTRNRTTPGDPNAALWSLLTFELWCRAHDNHADAVTMRSVSGVV
jgi:asparagine synthase (glutamine-hydrolysing)